RHPCGSPSGITGAASVPRTSRASSIRSSAHAGAARGSASRSCIVRSRPITARSWWTAGQGRARNSPFTCRRGGTDCRPIGGLESMGLRVLVVDDESAILHTLQILLRGEGFEVAVARTGREALERFAEFGPDVVLTDIRMPGMD